ncbi:hypothetical protein BpHYR1_002904 [Brachionus plicatilis]|uniref:Uncharacterized protein n=1 Tax=Brachionus plicatilis TaxID=10195 RepID=A0A3M7PU68_BRAPC|nr:hypothetical protein BpHYR1_002904 [Brachionus plicatilis]
MNKFFLIQTSQDIILIYCIIINFYFYSNYWQILKIKKLFILFLKYGMKWIFRYKHRLFNGECVSSENFFIRIGINRKILLEELYTLLAERYDNLLKIDFRSVPTEVLKIFVSVKIIGGNVKTYYENKKI